MIHKAKKIVIITEKVIEEGVARLITAEGATGWTAVGAGGQGSRGMRPKDRPGVSDSFANVKFEVICGDAEMAERIADRVAATYFENYSGITYLEDVEILRPHKFV